MDYSSIIKFKNSKQNSKKYNVFLISFITIFFGLLSLVFFIISLIFGVPVFIEYFKTHLVRRFPTLIFAGFMLIISVLSLMCGIILEVVVKKHRQLFELFLIRTHNSDYNSK